MPITPESEYCLSGMVSCLEATSDIYSGVFRMSLDVDAIIDRHEEIIIPKSWIGRDLAEIVTSEVLRWRTERASHYDRMAMAIDGFFDMKSQIEEAIAFVMLRLIGNKPKKELDVETLTSPTTIRKCIEQSDRITKWFDLVADQYTRFKEDAQLLPMHDFLTLRRQEAERHNQERLNYLNSLLDEVSSKNQPKLSRAVRKIIKRSSSLAARTIGHDSLRAFLSGQEIIINGTLYNYAIRKTYDVIEHSQNPHHHHAPFNIEILSKQGPVLASGCVYFQDTPVLDQIVALSLHVRNKETELTLLKTANLTPTAAFAQDEQLMSLVKVKKERHHDIPAIMQERIEMLEHDLAEMHDRIENLHVEHMEELEILPPYPEFQNIAHRVNPHIMAALREIMPIPSNMFEAVTNSRTPNWIIQNEPLALPLAA